MSEIAIRHAGLATGSRHIGRAAVTDPPACATPDGIRLLTRF